MFERFMIKHLEKRGYLVLSNLTMEGLRFGIKNLYVVNDINPLEKKKINKVSFRKNSKKLLTSRK